MTWDERIKKAKKRGYKSPSIFNQTRYEISQMSTEEMVKLAKKALKTASQQMNRLAESGYKLSENQTKGLIKKYGTKDGSYNLSSKIFDDIMEKKTMEGQKLTDERRREMVYDRLMNIRQVVFEEQSTVEGRRQDEKNSFGIFKEYYKKQGIEFDFGKMGKVKRVYEDENGKKSIKTETVYRVFTGEYENDRKVYEEWTSDMISDFWDAFHELKLSGRKGEEIYDETFAEVLSVYINSDLSTNQYKLDMDEKRQEILQKYEDDNNRPKIMGFTDEIKSATKKKRLQNRRGY